jgi:hypothetical protein
METQKKLLALRSMYLGWAVFFSLSALAFEFVPDGIRWKWRGQPTAAFGFLMMGIFCWLGLARTIWKMKRLRLE